MNQSVPQYLSGRGGEQATSSFQLMEEAWGGSDSPEDLLLKPTDIEIESNIPWNVSFEEETPMFAERLDYLTPSPQNLTSFDAAANDSASSFVGQYNDSRSLPIDMRFNDGHILLISCYSCLFFISLVGNLCVLRAILGGGRKHRKSRVNLMLLHLAIADLIVSKTFLVHVFISWNSSSLYSLCEESITWEVFYQTNERFDSYLL